MEHSRTEQEITTIEDILSKLYSVKTSMEWIQQNNIEMLPMEKVQIHMLLNILKALDQYSLNI